MKVLKAMQGSWAFILILIGLLQPTMGLATDSATKQSIFDLMNYKEVLQVELETDIQNLQDNRRFTDYQAATLRFKDGADEWQKWDLKVRIRGNYRRIHCSEMPPLKLNFKKSSLKAAGLSKHDDLKLVTHCIEDKQLAQDLLMREYLAYKMYNELTDNSFRVQLLKITYKDQKSGKKIKQWGFVIEDTAQLKDRIDAENCEKCLNSSIEEFDAENAKLVAMYQYVVGNSDWDIHNGRNIKLLRQKGKVIAVPYDFDFTGVVNAPYAVANPNYQMKFVRDRIYLGFEELLAQMHNTLFYLEGKQKQMITVVKRFKHLPYNSRVDIIDYLEVYFDHMEDIQMAVRNPITRVQAVSP